MLVESGEVHKGVDQASTKRLTPEQVAQLTSLVTGKHKPKSGGFCGYDPHHGFIFYGKDSKILGHLEICFRCSDNRSDPPKGLSHSWDFHGLEQLVVKLGLPVFRDPKDWEKFFADRKAIKPQAGPEVTDP
jgi:hypothetical protein